MKLIIVLSIFFLNFFVIKACNESKCGSIITKCLLTKSCNCETSDSKCFEECYSCLGNFFGDCCSCVGFCPKSRISLKNLNSISHIEKLEEPFPKLFKALTKENDKLFRWTSYNLIQTQENKTLQTQIINHSEKNNNCRVSFMSKCISWTRCKSSCAAIGSNSYRWFHNGCCECIGENCLNYGLDEGKCSDCPAKSDEVLNDSNSLIDNISNSISNLKNVSLTSHNKNEDEIK